MSVSMVKSYPLSLAIMSEDERTCFMRKWRYMTASEELAIHNGYLRFDSVTVIEFAEGVFVRRGDR